jgi:hypothetical protein
MDNVISTDKYWIYDNKLIFKPDFDESLDDYLDLLKNCTQLIFANYDSLDLVIKTENKYLSKYMRSYRDSQFSQSFVNSLNNSNNLTSLTLRSTYNKSLFNLVIKQDFGKNLVL